MSIFNDDRRYSEDEDEYRMWKQEVEREYRMDEAYDDYAYERRESEPF